MKVRLHTIIIILWGFILASIYCFLPVPTKAFNDSNRLAALTCLVPGATVVPFTRTCSNGQAAIDVADATPAPQSGGGDEQQGEEKGIKPRKQLTCANFVPNGGKPADQEGSGNENYHVGVGTYGWGLICDHSQSSVFMGLVVGISNWLVGLIGAVIVLMIIIGGVQMVTSAGSPDAVKAAKGRITNAIMSLVVLISMRAILALVSIGTAGTSFFGGTFDAATYDSLGAVPALIVLITNFTLFIAGAVSVMFIIVGALRYAASGGNQTNLQKAKLTISYAVIGLVVSISAVAIVNFIISNIK